MKSQIYLNGKWKFAPTHDQKPNNNHNVIETHIPMYACERLVRTDWENVDVPGVWERYAEKYSVYEGVCWFYREFYIESISYENFFAQLVFKGINYRADIYVNEQCVGWHESGYTEFSIDVTSVLKEGTNSIAVQVDNRGAFVKWPNDWGYGVYGGIHRDVFIELYGESFVKDINITPDYDVQNKKGVLSISGKTVGNIKEVQVCLDDKVNTIAVSDGAFCEKIEYDNITPWSPESPVLYDMMLTACGQVWSDIRIGFRNVVCKNRKLLLNGENINLKGVCYVYDTPEFGLVMDKNQLVEDLTMMKNANVNAIRTHYPMSDDFYKLCDELGFAVWIEPNIYCSKPADDVVNTIFSQQEFIDAAVSMTEEMISGGRRFASVIIWGIGNECNTEHPEALPFFEKVAETVRNADSTRVIGYASLYGKVGNIGHLVDIMGINSYYGWYDVIDQFDIEDKLETENGFVKKREADMTPLKELIENVEKLIPPDAPILLTEFGADSVPGYYSTACELWSENYHAEVIEKYIGTAKEYDCVSGTFVFAFSDYQDPSKPMNGRWNGLNLKGLVRYDRTIKKPYNAIKNSYK